MEKIYWTTKTGEKIDVDEMSITHLRNTLKMIIKGNNKVPKTCPYNTEAAEMFLEEEIYSMLPADEEWLWK